MCKILNEILKMEDNWATIIKSLVAFGLIWDCLNLLQDEILNWLVKSNVIDQKGSEKSRSCKYRKSARKYGRKTDFSKEIGVK